VGCSYVQAKLRTCADSLDKVRKEAQDALHLEQARMSARRKIVADGANDIHNTLFMAILKQQEAFEKQVRVCRLTAMLDCV